MNKKLEETFNLPSMEDAMENQKEADKVADDLDHSSTAAHKEMEAESSKELDPDVVSKALSTAEKIDKALPQVKDLESHDSDMDTYSTEAIKSYKELMDLGMASEARHAGKFFEVAQTMMKNAIEAKNAKADKKLRMIELQLKKQRVDQWDSRTPKSDDIIEGEGYVVGDRNKLLDQIIDRVNENDKNSNKGDK
jgi:hypothetical protein